MRRTILQTIALALVMASAFAAAPTAYAQGCECTGQCQLNGGHYSCGFCIWCCTLCTSKPDWCMENACIQPGGKSTPTTTALIACKVMSPTLTPVPAIRVLEVHPLPART